MAQLTVKSVVEDGIARLVLSAPDRRNPLSVETMELARDALLAFGEDAAVRVVIVDAEGPAFSAGHDLREMIGRTLDEERRVFDTCVGLMEAVQGIPQPVIAKVRGAAVAAGCQLVATCDLAIAGEGAVFATPGVRIGLFCSTPMVALTRSIGRKRAMHMLLTGDTVDAVTAADWGLVNAVVPEARLDEEIDRLAARIAAASPLTLRIGKQAFYRQVDLPQADAYREMSATMAANAVTCDAQEGITAFVEKREPEWRGE